MALLRDSLIQFVRPVEEEVGGRWRGGTCAHEVGRAGRSEERSSLKREEEKRRGERRGTWMCTGPLRRC